jgi:hypothetical protein
LTGYNFEHNQIIFETDRLKDSNGNLYQLDGYFKNWISFDLKRQRPCIIIDKNEYFLFYDKNNIYNEDILHLARSKDGHVFGEYSQLFPYNPNDEIKNYGYDNLKNCFVIKEEKQFFAWTNSTITNIDSTTTNKIINMQSDYTGDNWS